MISLGLSKDVVQLGQVDQAYLVDSEDHLDQLHQLGCLGQSDQLDSLYRLYQSSRLKTYMPTMSSRAMIVEEGNFSTVFVKMLTPNATASILLTEDASLVSNQPKDQSTESAQTQL